jgi:hypothetical protein
VLIAVATGVDTLGEEVTVVAVKAAGPRATAREAAVRAVEERVATKVAAVAMARVVTVKEEWVAVATVREGVGSVAGAAGAAEATGLVVVDKVGAGWMALAAMGQVGEKGKARAASTVEAKAVAEMVEVETAAVTREAERWAKEKEEDEKAAASMEGVVKVAAVREPERSAKEREEEEKVAASREASRDAARAVEMVAVKVGAAKVGAVMEAGLGDQREQDVDI